MKKLTFTLTAISLLFTSSFAFAQNKHNTHSGIYAGVGGGIGKTKAGYCDDWRDAFDTVDKCDKKANVWKVFAGYQFNQYIGAEIEYLKSQDYEYKITHDFGGGLGTLTSEPKADFRTFGFSAVGKYPFNDRFSMFGRAGAHLWKLEGIDVWGLPGKDDGTDLLLGGGVEYRPWENFGVRAEHARYFKDDDDIDVSTIQFVLYFKGAYPTLDG